MKRTTCVMALAFGALAVLADESRPDFTATMQKQIDDAAMAGGGRVVVRLENYRMVSGHPEWWIKDVKHFD